MIGTTLPSAAHRTLDFLDSSPHYLESGVPHNVFADMPIQGVSSLTWLILESTYAPSSTI